MLIPLASKLIALIAVFLFLHGCTTEGRKSFAYDVLRSHEAEQCRELPETARIQCIEGTDLRYSEYKKQREQGLITAKPGP